MKTKSKYIIVLLFNVLLSVSACDEEFLERSPETAYTSENFFATESDFQRALAGTYNALRAYAAGTTGSQTQGWIMGEQRSDNTHYDFNPQNRGNNAQAREGITDFIDISTNNQTQAKWDYDYIAISRANAILDRIGTASFEDTKKNPIIGEVKFLRAFFYFDLVQFFGGVPLQVHEVRSPNEASLPRVSAEEVYDQIIADLTDAISKLTEPTSFPQSGRATKGSAKTLLANVYMVQKKYAQAESLLKEVTQMGYQLLPDYASVYALNNKNSSESIFEIQFMQGTTAGQNSNFIYWFIPRVTNSTVITGVNTNTNTGDYGGWNVPTRDLIDSYEAGDKRLDASIAVAEGTYNASGVFVPEGVKSIVNYLTPAGKVSKLFIRKYLHAHSNQYNTDDNWPVYRYSEALLFLAEALNEQGKSSEALPYLNQVRTRAGLAAVTETNQAALREIILHERRVELAFENKRWLDLVRTGKVVQVMNAYGAKIKATFPETPPNAYQVDQHRLLFPIPELEMQRNINLKGQQNPGY
ncbi:MAG: RagB/SusD family nutrient uptake outer membrane protein [Mangrovibacterium sp.]